MHARESNKASLTLFLPTSTFFEAHIRYTTVCIVLVAYSIPIPCAIAIMFTQKGRQVASCREAMMCPLCRRSIRRRPCGPSYIKTRLENKERA